ncbi:MAG: hypothetical protein A2908_01415 [Candidatus Staskawiczbacteria bacterium RIFCSPLOWO2_01_FULL_38_12b]|uniref:Uncharacterized protein n=1 Tax=Candidatus Staskawiczbacteria bacterium RIFCSPLOWO2_01_FULL_38_12b TaxID=1802214 RepID=A0A1G2ICN5_9BACT|nr:MAG: hypothetical protein A2908_01415 [Candidatus Staskawiczbacteria bacterium RIFCSPLOWO2_01_FULL_38_12b]
MAPGLEKCLGAACLRITHFYEAGGKIIRKEAETLFIFCQTRFALIRPSTNPDFFCIFLYFKRPNVDCLRTKGL